MRFRGTDVVLRLFEDRGHVVRFLAGCHILLPLKVRNSGIIKCIMFVGTNRLFHLRLRAPQNDLNGVGGGGDDNNRSNREERKGGCLMFALQVLEGCCLLHRTF